MFAPIGCKVELLNGPVRGSTNKNNDDLSSGVSTLMYWRDNVAYMDPGFLRADDLGELDYTGLSFKFTREDGSYTIAEAGANQLVGDVDGYRPVSYTHLTLPTKA